MNCTGRVLKQTCKKLQGYPTTVGNLFRAILKYKHRWKGGHRPKTQNVSVSQRSIPF